MSEGYVAGAQAGPAAVAFDTSRGREIAVRHEVVLRRPHGDAPLVIDGSAREGGGQILTLSMLTGKPLVLERIRGRRSKPGLLRQHVTCVNAAAAVSYRHGAELARRSPRTAPLSRVNH